MPSCIWDLGGWSRFRELNSGRDLPGAGAGSRLRGLNLGRDLGGWSRFWRRRLELASGAGLGLNWGQDLRGWSRFQHQGLNWGQDLRGWSRFQHQGLNWGQDLRSWSRFQHQGLSWGRDLGLELVLVVGAGLGRFRRLGLNWGRDLRGWSRFQHQGLSWGRDLGLEPVLVVRAELSRAGSGLAARDLRDSVSFPETPVGGPPPRFHVPPLLSAPRVGGCSPLLISFAHNPPPASQHLCGDFPSQPPLSSLAGPPYEGTSVQGTPAPGASVLLPPGAVHSTFPRRKIRLPPHSSAALGPPSKPCWGAGFWDAPLAGESLYRALTTVL
ncbi:uncharacterized protein LOC122463704 [Chelonia mydas]|uniref:uncharacterized protein LOC122463704 n=1 Tax=Chelonia mydas TaxID=8469 RepID=UPI001CAA1C9D|nr:uncharacterized protein LOC122463704 [Chelonia mydas]